MNILSCIHSLLPTMLVVARHGESIGNIPAHDAHASSKLANHRYPLTPKGVRQCEATREYLKQFIFTLGFASTFVRSQESFTIFFPAQKYIEDPRLNEWWKGIYHSMSKDEREKFYPGEDMIRKKEGLYHYRPLQGESGMDIDMRIFSFLQFLALLGPQANRTFVAGHGRWMVSLLRLIQGRAVEDFELMHKDTENYPDNASLLIILRTPTKDVSEVKISYVVPWKSHEMKAL